MPGDCVLPAGSGGIQGTFRRNQRHVAAAPLQTADGRGGASFPLFFRGGEENRRQNGIRSTLGVLRMLLMLFWWAGHDTLSGGRGAGQAGQTDVRPKQGIRKSCSRRAMCSLPESPFLWIHSPHAMENS